MLSQAELTKRKAEAAARRQEQEREAAIKRRAVVDRQVAEERRKREARVAGLGDVMLHSGSKRLPEPVLSLIYAYARPAVGEGWAARLRVLAEALRGAEHVTVVTFEIAPPSKEEVARVEAELGVRLPAELRRFYTHECNGARLIWRHASDEDCAPRTEMEAEVAHPLADQLWIGCAATGALLIPPLAPLLLTADRDFAGMMHFGQTDATVRFRGQEYNEEVFKKAMRPVDNFHSFDFMCMFVDPDKSRFSSHPDPHLILASNSGASLTSSYTIRFSAYLEWVLLTCCVSAQRKAVFAPSRFAENMDLRDVVLQSFELDSVAEAADVRANVARVLVALDSEWS